MSDEFNTNQQFNDQLLPDIALPAVIVTAPRFTLYDWYSIWNNIFARIAPQNPVFINPALTYQNIIDGYRLGENPFRMGLLWRITASGRVHPDDVKQYIRQEKILYSYMSAVEAAATRLGQDSSKADEGPVEGTFVASNDAGAMPASNIGGIPDITDKLNKLMREHEENYKYARLLPFEARLTLFYNLVRNGGSFDLKNKPDWQHDKFIYNGEVVDKDVPGNINYGYLGKVFGFPDTLLYAAAGAAQIAAGTSKHEWQNSKNWGDDPRDTYRIGQGIELYMQKWR
ncbi:polymorphic toxin type 44 domain-containing protein [Sporomusa sphaeroides DSM 2875]|uniref:polymorphic toxin type 44 domain-containing protein n=1 Tax=Sporomusa sphaeroides TaxID=47679 RepID=UPI00202EAA41|nr:polymorphic toxin type 44 domain-containing protein [Sporomusa sphaeroides]MCM0759457.1 polymorphic toxin type 44 domain-containing protein [Sporomusa sphaeroides DSM 2875]